jgi:hypothetical protein
MGVISPVAMQKDGERVRAERGVDGGPTSAGAVCEGDGGVCRKSGRGQW